MSIYYNRANYFYKVEHSKLCLCRCTERIMSTQSNRVRVYTVEQNNLCLHSRTELIFSTQQVYCIGSVQVTFITHTNHSYQDWCVLISWLPLIFRFRQFCRTFDLSYTLPAHRATVYIMGIVLGLGLRYCGRDFRLKWVCERFEVICAVTVNIAVFCVLTALVWGMWTNVCGYLLLPSAW